MKILKPLLTLSLIANLVVGAKVLYKRTHVKKVIATFDGWDATRTSIFDSLHIDTMDIVFVGNSLTESFPLNEIYGPQIKNRGINGNTSLQVLDRIEKIASCRPRKIFIEVGINDLQTGSSPDSLLHCYINIIQSVGKYNVPLYIQSLFPVRNEFEVHMRNINTVNFRLKKLCDSTGVRYIDVYSRLLKGGELDRSLTDDGIHLNGAGCMVWKKVIDPFVN